MKLQTKYANVDRCIVTRERYENIFEKSGLKSFDYENKSFREPLIEHVGHLPIIATFLHPHIENSSKVDLGRVLIMLSIHDIGETVLGDIPMFKKTKEQGDKEFVAAMGVLHENLKKYFQEFENHETLDAKFAKSVDSIAGLLHEIDLPKITIGKHELYGFDEDVIDKKKRKHFQWDKVLLEVFEYCLDQYKVIKG